MSIHLKTSLLVITGVILAGCASKEHVVPFEMEEQAIEAVDVPSAALSSLRNLAGANQLATFEKEDRGAFVAYEAEWLVDGVEHEATVMADGTLLETEKEFLPEEMDALPPAIRDRVRELQGEGYEVEAARREIILYDVDATRPGAPEDAEGQEYLLRPDGKPVIVGR